MVLKNARFIHVFLPLSHFFVNQSLKVTEQVSIEISRFTLPQRTPKTQGMLQCPTSPTATTFPSNSAPASTGCTRFARNQSPTATHSRLISAWLRRNSWNEIDPSQRVATAQGEREEANVGGRIEMKNRDRVEGSIKGGPL